MSGIAMRTLRGFSFLTVLTCALSGAIAHADEVTIAVDRKSVV